MPGDTAFAANIMQDKYQLAGLDDRERGFSRPVEFERSSQEYRAILRYESTRVISEPSSTQESALLHLIHTLQAEGYRQLKTQMSFRNGTYLGSQEPWVDYPDPPADVRPASRLWATVLGWFGVGKSAQ
jgi:hypothetical protein